MLDRIAALEQGVALSENTATVIGAVGSKKVNFVVDKPVISAQVGSFRACVTNGGQAEAHGYNHMLCAVLHMSKRHTK